MESTPRGLAARPGLANNTHSGNVITATRSLHRIDSMVLSWKSQLAPEATFPATNVLTLLKMPRGGLDKNDPSEPIPKSPTTRTPPPPSDDHTQSTNTPLDRPRP